MGRLGRSTILIAASSVAVMLLASLAVVEFMGSADAGDSGRPEILVYSNNVENLMTPSEKCQGDWDELVHYMSDGHSPDIILLQQVRGQRQVDTYVRAMEKHGKANFKGLVADAESDGGGVCGEEKNKQLNAIIWNTDSLDYVKDSVDTWQSLRENPKSAGGQCAENKQSRTVNVKANFTNQSGHKITAASVHWPTHVSGNALCADDNSRLLASELKQKSYRDSALQIVGGDFNYADINLKLKWCKWYRQLHVDNKFTDPVRDECGSDKDCIAKLWTHIRHKDGIPKKRRIDYLFVRRGTSGAAEYKDAKVVGFNAADKAERRHHDEDESDCRTYPDRPGCHYSEHRAVTARVF